MFDSGFALPAYSLESDWREILRLTSSHEHALKLFKEAYEIFRAADEESRHGVGEDGVKERRQLQTFLAEALELKLLTRRDIERIEEEIAAGTRPVSAMPNGSSFDPWVEKCLPADEPLLPVSGHLLP